MQIDPTIEGPTRKLFGHAIRGEYEEFQRELMAIADDESLRRALLLAIAVAAYVVVDDHGGRQPSDAELRELAEPVAEIETRIAITAEEANTYLSKVVFGGQALTEGFPDEDAVRLPFIITAILLGSAERVDDAHHWWDYLDVVEAELEKA